MEDYTSTARDKTNSREIDGIKEDLRTLQDNVKSLKSNAVTLAHDLKAGGGAVAREGLDHLKTAGQDEFQKIESYVKAKPVQSLAMAFAAGLVANFLLGGRR